MLESNLSGVQDFAQPRGTDNSAFGSSLSFYYRPWKTNAINFGVWGRAPETKTGTF